MPDGVFARERQQQIARIVEETGRARVTELAGSFGVSAVTIRKDLLVLEGERRVIRTHGGAIALGRQPPRACLRHPGAAPARGEVAHRCGRSGAASSDGESIVLDASTTALYVARHLKDREPTGTG